MAKGRCDDCVEHSGIEARLDKVEQDTKAQWGAIDRMRAWVIAGMGAVILQLALALVDVLKKGHGAG